VNASAFVVNAFVQCKGIPFKFLPKLCYASVIRHKIVIYMHSFAEDNLLIEKVK